MYIKNTNVYWTQIIHKIAGRMQIIKKMIKPGEEDMEMFLSSCEQMVVPLRKQEYQRAEVLGDLLRFGSLKFT